MSILHVRTGPGDFATIQAAVDAAANGDTIDIAAGTYREQVTVSGKVLTIHGAGDGAGGTIIGTRRMRQPLVVDAIDPNAGRPNKFAVIAVTNDANVTIEGVAVDGREQGFIPGASAYDFVGVYVLDSDAVINGVAASNIDDTVGPPIGNGQRDFAIIATSHDAAHGGLGPHTVTIEHSTLSNFQKGGMLLNGATLTVDIHDNTITGAGAQTGNMAQNGIQVGGASAAPTAPSTTTRSRISAASPPHPAPAARPASSPLPPLPRSTSATTILPAGNRSAAIPILPTPPSQSSIPSMAASPATPSRRMTWRWWTAAPSPPRCRIPAIPTPATRSTSASSRRARRRRLCSLDRTASTRSLASMAPTRSPVSGETICSMAARGTTRSNTRSVTASTPGQSRVPVGGALPGAGQSVECVLERQIIVRGGSTGWGRVAQAVFASGSYASRTYTILSAAGGLAGTTFNNVDHDQSPRRLHRESELHAIPT